MKLSPSDKQRIEKQFDHFCKVVLKNEKKDICKHNKYLLVNEKAFSELTYDELNQLYSLDDYSDICFRIIVLGFEISIEDERLFKAIKALPEKRKTIILLSYWLGMTDKEISRTLKLVRRTVSYMRINALKQLKQYLEHIPGEKP